MTKRRERICLGWRKKGAAMSVMLTRREGLCLGWRKDGRGYVWDADKTRRAMSGMEKRREKICLG